MAPAGLGMPGLPRWLRRPVGRAVQAVGWLNAKGPINRARRGQSLPPVGADPTSGASTLCAWSPALLPRPDDWPTSRFTVTGRWHLPTLDWTPDPELVAFLDAGDPPVFVGFGSMRSFSGMDRLLDALLAGLAPRRVLLAVDTDRPLPENVHRVTGFVPHDWLFPRCSVIVHHCGAGTSHEAAASRVPSIPVPISMDQPFWADRLHRLGIAASPLNPRRPDVELVRWAVAKAESEPVGQAAAVIGAQMASESGLRTAVAKLEAEAEELTP